MRQTLTAIACLAALVLAAGCGESDEEQAREVVQEYVDASNDEDFETVCDLYSDELKQQFGADDCPGFVEEQSSGVEQELEFVDVRVNDDTASAQVDAVRDAEGGPARIGLTLERRDGDWKITAFQ